MKPILAWHFLRMDQRTKFMHGSSHGQGIRARIKKGTVLHCNPRAIELCYYGLHASIEPLSALFYAPGPIITRVQCSGHVIKDVDKLACSERKVIWVANATETLKEFTRWCAFQVIHLWDVSDIVVKFLKTGNESLRLSAAASITALTLAENAHYADAAATVAARTAARAARAAAYYATTNTDRGAATYYDTATDADATCYAAGRAANTAASAVTAADAADAAADATRRAHAATADTAAGCCVDTKGKQNAKLEEMLLALEPKT